MGAEKAHEKKKITQFGECQCRFGKCRFSAELEKLEKIFEMGGSVEKQIQKSLGPAFSLCRCAGIDAALAKADFFFAGAPTIEKWRLTLSK